jgi:hypothetical protein
VRNYSTTHIHRTAGQQRGTCSSERGAGGHHIIDKQYSLTTNCSLANHVARPMTALLASRTSLSAVIDTTQTSHASHTQRPRGICGDNRRLIMTASSHPSLRGWRPGDEVGSPVIEPIVHGTTEIAPEPCGNPTSITKLHEVNRSPQFAAVMAEREHDHRLR